MAMSLGYVDYSYKGNFEKYRYSWKRIKETMSIAQNSEQVFENAIVPFYYGIQTKVDKQMEHNQVQRQTYRYGNT